MQERGNICELKVHADCTNKAEQVDHIISLSSNELNKKLRKIKGENGKKTPTQSFGSNNYVNFALACKRCNAFKKNAIPSKEVLIRLLN